MFPKKRVELSTSKLSLPKQLFDFAYFPEYDNVIYYLAENLAQKENWDCQHTSTLQNKPILRNYLNYTFKRLQEEDKISFFGERAFFNTGLVTENQEEIFAVFEEHRNPSKQKFYFYGFYKESDYELRSCQALPERASYFQDPAILIYDTRLGEPRIDYDHIKNKKENRERFPEPYKSMDDYQLQVYIEGAVRLAIKRVKRNYKAAVPQYFWDKNASSGSLQLLLPLCLTTRSRADLALVIHKDGNVYTGETVLTIDQAYNNARLLAKPDTEWLEP
ncbi:DUF3825 domain-containing protein [Planktothrix agardhii]|jgi:hypothetical protein|uniref:DUF3825 domain-containing protein n=1 Tax=Planktothrix agardhii TaxID=1160 RepID=UPI000DBB1544|nr:DUF3825 domain-containing protein [Planktothrix agardhii]MCF3578665.1 DUF3825 domain-containing protein [Planktothrix agardhii 1812]MCF3646463.1 DUF3825 domain-containing protein [Planktothrix agardhii 1026]BBD55250.1 hypothetical protein NIES204_25520 [Planktothrix agardhii NIES-204]CAD5946450.1 hypothetical protein NO2A_02717 [Planktothrix agardhii]